MSIALALYALGVFLMWLSIEQFEALISIHKGKSCCMVWWQKIPIILLWPAAAMFLLITHAVPDKNKKGDSSDER